MVYMVLIAAAIVFAIMAIWARRLIASALWLAGVSAVLSTVFYLMGAHQLAVIELSIGAGLVTLLFVFAIGVAGEGRVEGGPVVPQALAWGLVILTVVLLGWLVLPQGSAGQAVSGPTLATVLWHQRGLDVLVQIVLIFAGVLGLLGLLAEAKAPLEQSVAEEVAARRERDLLAMQQQVLEKEKEIS